MESVCFGPIQKNADVVLQAKFRGNNNPVRGMRNSRLSTSLWLWLNEGMKFDGRGGGIFEPPATRQRAVIDFMLSFEGENRIPYTQAQSEPLLELIEV